MPVSSILRVVLALDLWAFEGRNERLSAQQVTALFSLAEGPLVVATLRERTGCLAAQMSRILRTLEEYGLISREIGKPDMRFVVIRLTEKGRKKVASLCEKIEGRLLVVRDDLLRLAKTT
jgi:DNA-binding MarR family transcriptional regulator